MILNFNYASCLGNNKNTLYPHEAHVTNIDELKKVVERDYVLYKFKNNRRSINNFLYADYLAFDLDNDHSDEAKDWITTNDIKQAFPDVSFVAITSRHHNLVKGKRSARPRFHVIFEVDRINDAKVLVDMIHKVNDIFPFFDIAAMDAGRFFYGSMNSKFVWFNGKRTLSDYLKEINTLDESLKAFEEYCETGIPYQIIESSSRNRRDKSFEKALNTLHVYSTELGITLVSEPIDDKTNEIPVGQQVLSKMDLRGKVITCDALNTQKELTEIITKSHGEYVLPVKENQKKLKEDIELYFDERIDKTKVLYKKELDKESSKIVIREYYLSPEISWCYETDKWTNIQGFGMVHKTVENLITKETSEEKKIFYFII